MNHTTALLVGPLERAGTRELVRELGAAAHLIIAVDGGADVCRRAGVSCDLVVGDFDSVSAAELDLLVEEGATLVRYPRDKDETDLDLALIEAGRIDCTHLSATGFLAGRLDHTLAALGSLARVEQPQLYLVEPDLSGWMLSSGDALELEGIGATISVFALLDDARVSVVGMRWPLHEQTLPALSSRGVSNVITGPDACISVTSGRVVVLSPELDGTKPATGIRRNTH